jgi:CheY-like chemotaxis protein
MARKIVILEDNAERRLAMQDCLQDRFYQFEARFFDEPAAMIDYLRTHLPETAVIGLDHDLELKPGPDGKLKDPGTGREVADFLARQPPTCPVVIHTTNSAAATGMEMALREARWETHCVSPYGDLEWIPTQWFRTIRRAVVGPTTGRQRSGRPDDRP